MASFLSRALTSIVVYAYGIFTVILFGLIAITKGTFFKRPTEKEKLELQLARDRFWNLSKSIFGLSHHILTLRNGFKFHFVSNEAPGTPAALKSPKHLVIFLHGFPDSWAVWRHVISSPSLQNAANLVALDLPGYGGTDSVDKYTATNVLERLTEVIIALRTQYGVDTGSESNKKKIIIVAHDWGCVLAMRLAAEAPSLAHRFILTNGPLPSLVVSNVRRLITSAQKMFKTTLRSPLRVHTPLLQAFRTLSPLLRQAALSGYVFVMQLPLPFVHYFLMGGNLSLMKAVHKGSYGGVELAIREAAECMASTMGPSVTEAQTQTASGETYPTTLQDERAFSNVIHMASYYRHNAWMARWQKSAETVTSLHSIAGGTELRRSSSGAGLFEEGPPGVLKANSTVIWGQQDIALDPHICLDGIADYLSQNSQVVMLPRAGHFTPVEVESRAVLVKVVQWAVQGEKEDLAAVVQAADPDAKVTVRK